MTRRVLHVIGTLGVGGAERQLVLACRALKDRGVESHVVYLREPSPLREVLVRGGVPSTGLNMGPEKWAVPLAVPRIRKVIRDFRPDVVHTSLVPGDIAGGLAAKLEGIPTVGTLCAIAGRSLLEDNPHQSRWKSWLQTELWGASLRRTHDQVVAISQAVRDCALRDFHLPAEKVSVIYRAIHEATSVPALDEEERTRVRQTIGVGPGETVILAVGRLVPVKGHRYLIQALSKLRQEGKNVRLWIAGEGWLRPELEELARQQGVQDFVTLLGRRKDVPQLVRACDIFAFPSLHEGLGVALLEAASMGVPIVTTDKRPMTEIVVHEVSGLCVPPKSSDALASALGRLNDEPAFAKRLAARAEQDANEKFHIEHTTQQLLDVYARASPAFAR